MTLPAHASILTGLTPRTHGIHVNGSSRLDDGVATLATVLKQSGYRTGAFVGAFVLDARFGLSRGFDEYDDRYPHEADAATFKVADRRAAEVVKAAGDWILQSRRWPEPASRQPVVRVGAPVRSAYAVRRARRSTAPDARRTTARSRTPMRCSGNCSTVSAAPVRSIAPLIVVTADHGESLGDHGETTHGLFAYESTLAVPLIVSGAAVGRGVVDVPVAHADILPTIVDLLGVHAAAESRRPVGRRAACRRPAGVLRSAGSEPDARLGAADRRRVRRLEVHRSAAARALQPPHRSGRSAQPRRARARAPRHVEARARRSSRRRRPGAAAPAAVDDEVGGAAAVAWLHGGLRRARAATVHAQSTIPSGWSRSTRNSIRRWRRSMPGGPTRRCRGSSRC